MGILKQLRERRLFQIAVSYAGIGWAVLEVTDQLADRGIIPELIYRLVLIWALIGIPASLLIGWHHGEKGKQRAPVSEIAVLAVLAMLALGMSASTVGRQRVAAQFAARFENPLDLRHIAVMYFRDHSPNGDYQYLADGFTEDLIATLSQVQGLTVISRNGSLQFRSADVSADSVARALGAGTIIEGSVEPRGRKLRIQLSLIEGQSGAAFERVTLDLDATDELVLRDSVAEQTSRLLRSYLGEEVRMQRMAAGTSSRAAWTLVQRAEKARKDAEAARAERDVTSADQLFARADSLLLQAEQADGTWAQPSIERAALWWKRVRLAGNAPAEVVRLTDIVIGHADEALRRSRTAARAYELRGTANYYRWLFNLETDARARDALLASARTDLETALRYDQLLASAHSTISHMYSVLDDMSNSVLEAEKAYQADMYLELADVVLLRLFDGSVHLGFFNKAKSWCDEGVKRFPAHSQLAACPLRLMITPGVEQPDIDTAWAIAARTATLSPAERAEAERVQNEMQVAGVIAKVARREQNSALADSARAVLRRASAAAVHPDVDPSRALLAVEAYIWLLIGDEDRAVDVLRQYAAINGADFARSRGESSWWWRDLEDHPEFRELMGLH